MPSAAWTRLRGRPPGLLRRRDLADRRGRRHADRRRAGGRTGAVGRTVSARSRSSSRRRWRSSAIATPTSSPTSATSFRLGGPPGSSMSPPTLIRRERRRRGRGGRPRARPASCRTVWLHIDLDVLDRDVFAATDYLMPGGLELERADRPRPARGRRPPTSWVGRSSCYNPEKDPLGRDGRAIVAAIEALFGPAG